MKKAAILLVALLMTTCLVFYPSMIETVEAPNPANKWIYIFVNSTIRSSIQTSLDQYKSDLNEAGFKVEIRNAVANIRHVLWQGYESSDLYGDLLGCLLIGEIRPVWFEENVSDPVEEWFPTDIYFMDLDGVWEDTDDDGAYDNHTGNVEPEIWVGRIKADNIVGYGNETDLLNNYFNKIHSYRNGSLTLPKRALVYFDEPGSVPIYSNMAYKNVKQAYDEVTLVEYPETNPEDYKNRLNQSYELVHVFTHGWPSGQDFMGGTVPSKYYLDNDPPVFFYTLSGCELAKYKAMNIHGETYDPTNYLAGACIFAEKYGLLAIGSTTENAILRTKPFYKNIAEGKCVGEAFKEWFTSWIRIPHKLTLYSYTIIGDPMLRPRSPVTNVTHALPYRHEGDDTTAIYPQWSVNVTTIVKNLGTTTKTFNVTAYASADNVTYSNGTQTTANLTSGAEDMLTFTWDTRDIPWPYTYTISAEARINTTRNTGFDREPLRVRIPGDTNDDGMVDIVDISFIGAHMGYQWPDEEYDWQADINGDGTIDIVDVVAAAIYFGYGT